MQLLGNQEIRTSRAGFTLVELLVVIGIVVIVSVLVIVGYASFRGSILLSNLTYEVALTIREAQVYGLGAREATISGSDFDTGYGIFFDRDTPDRYVLFADLNRDFSYNGDTEKVQTYTLQDGYAISRLCGELPGGNEICSNAAIRYLAIVFDRPEPDAILRSNIPGHKYQGALIVIRSPQGDERSITISAAGQIAVQGDNM